jgi:CheY-like chemotaxis protein
VLEVALDVVKGPKGSTARIIVRDNGMGMTEDTIPTIFGLFTQADVPLARPKGGLGVGLTLVQTLVRLHGGTVKARSEGLGTGSEFEIQLPVLQQSVAPREDARGQRGASERRASGARRKVLLIEDSTDLRELMKDLLEIWGHEVVCAADGTAGIALAVAQAPDVALVDIGLPGIDGYEVARRLRRESIGERIKLVAITGYASAEQKSKALESGFDHHLPKPVNADRLAEILGDAASRAGAPRAE